MIKEAETLDQKLSTLDRWLIRAVLACFCIAALSWAFCNLVYKRREPHSAYAYDHLENNLDELTYEQSESASAGGSETVEKVEKKETPPDERVVDHLFEAMKRGEGAAK